MATAAPIDARTHGYYCCALMATTAPIDMRTHGYYRPHRYAHSWNKRSDLIIIQVNIEFKTIISLKLDITEGFIKDVV